MKMLFPSIAAWVEKQYGDPGGWIDATQVWALVSVAPKTAETKVFERRRASMLLGDDVVDWEREEWIFVFVNAAVLTPPARSLPNLGSEPSVHHAAPFWPTILRALA